MLQNRRKMMKLLISTFLLMLCGIAAFGQKEEVKKFATDAEVPRITVEEAKKAFDDKSAIFIDSRSEEAFAGEHIKGASQIKSAAEDRFDKLPKGKKIIVYCS
jgi:3-mercaptopyruvate sulfurtransferase SseA